MILRVEVRENELAEDLCNSLTREQLVRLIRRIDEHEADWAFTKTLAAHFSKEMREYRKEQRSDNAQGGSRNG